MREIITLEDAKKELASLERMNLDFTKSKDIKKITRATVLEVAINTMEEYGLESLDLETI